MRGKHQHEICKLDALAKLNQLPRAARVASSRLVVRAQQVDAPPSNQLIGHCFRQTTDPSGCTQSNLNRVVFCSNQRSRATLPVENSCKKNCS
jgi:hypothetical protein